MSASNVVDLNPTTLFGTSIGPAAGVGSTPASGTIIGQGLDFTMANGYCNVWAVGGPSLSGAFRVAVQCAGSNTSGSYTDPTSGLSQFPSNLISGGILVCNSGVNVSGNNSLSGGSSDLGAFLRPAGQPWVRAMVLSGDQANAPVTVGFIEQALITGSGVGFSYLPSSGVINV